MKKVFPRALARPLVATAMAVSLVAGSAGVAVGVARAPRHDTDFRSIPMSHSGAKKSVPGEVLVKFTRAPASARAVGARSIESFGVKGWKLVRLRGGESVDHAIARFRHDPNVEDATSNHVYYAQSVPNDTFFGVQWGLQNTGQSVLGVSGTPGADISAPSAWDVTTGSSSIVVAVADSGVDAHPDLAGNVISGQNFVPGRPSTSTWDAFGHGSHVAGIVGARGNNEYGVTGVAQRIAIMPIRVLDESGTGDTSWIAAGFTWAASHGARVINASFGGSDADPAMQDAIAGHPNTLFVVAAGNSGRNNDTTPDYPCNFTLPNLICVAASDQNDNRASFSNYGANSVHLAAPGVNILSTYKQDSAGDGGSGYALSDSPAGGYLTGTHSWVESGIVTPPIVTPPNTTAKDCTLDYSLRASLGPNAVLTVETASTSSPSTWTTVDTFGGPSGFSTFGSYDDHTPGVAANGQPFRFRFRFDVTGAQTSDGVYLDNVGVKCNGGSYTALATNSFGSTLSGYTHGGTNDSWGTTSIAYIWVYMSGTSMATPMVTGAAGLLWAAHPNATAAGVKDAILRSVDLVPAFANKTVTGGRLNAAQALQMIDATPPTVSFKAGALSNPFQLSPTFSIGWSADDGTGRGVKDYSVRYEKANYNGGFGPWTNWKTNVTGTGAPFPGAVGYSYCFEVRARDNVLNTSAWSAPKCTAIPVNDTTLTAGAGWSRIKSSTRYLGDDTYSASKGATLTLANAYWRRIDLVVSVCSGCGSVAVYSGSTSLGIFSTNAPSFGTRHLLFVGSSSHVNGPVTITIRVTSASGHAVMIEGLGLLRY